MNFKIFFFLILLLPLKLFGQFSLSGRVLSLPELKPVANASVFLNNTTIGNNSSERGTFLLRNIKSGKYVLTVSILGFNTFRQEVFITNGNIALPDILLVPQIIALSQVTIKPVDDVQRERSYEWFKTEFLGKSDLAEDCKIMNPEVLDLNFDNQSGTLTASSEDFLEIQNSALGYKLKYKLSDFRLENFGKTDQTIRYNGSVLFEEMEGDNFDKARWARRRLQVYEGSFMHFLRAVINNGIDNEGFRVLKIQDNANPDRPIDSIIDNQIRFYEKKETPAWKDSLAAWKVKKNIPKRLTKILPEPQGRNDFLKITDKPTFYAFGLNITGGELLIQYNKKRNFRSIPAVINQNELINSKSTLIKFAGRYSFVDQNGVLIDPKSIVLNGFWGKYRVAELLPLDFEPPQRYSYNNSSSNPANIKAQPGDDRARTDLLKLKSTSDSIDYALGPERIYAQFDKPYYTTRDTIWFKVYLLNQKLAISEKSGIINIDIANDSSKVIKQYRFLADSGTCWGNIALNEKDFLPGIYTLRCYTNWMRNFSENSFFYKSFYLTENDENKWFITKQIHDTLINRNLSEEIKLYFNDFNKKPLKLVPLQLGVISDGKYLYNQKLQTDLNGFVKLNLAIPEVSRKSSLIVTNNQTGNKAIIPLDFSSSKIADIQFLPEGGYFIPGFRAHVGFKAIGVDGLGLQVSGIIVNKNQQKVADFRSLKNGMGSFDLDITENGKYTAIVSLPGAIQKSFELPAIKSSGTILHVLNPLKNDSLIVTLGATSDIIQEADTFYLIGKARGVVCYAATVRFNSNNLINRKIAKNLFPTGITHFFLLTIKNKPINERSTFIDHRDALTIQIISNKSKYKSRDSVSLKLKVTDTAGNPIAGNFSLAVTDDTQVEHDTINEENIITKLLLSSELRGFVETPGYYLSSKIMDDQWLALDNLLLTQGWTGFNWQDIFNHRTIDFQAEKEFKVNGIITNLFNKPIAGANVILLSKTPAFFKDTVTNSDGKFEFNHFPRIDTPVFVIKGTNRKGRSFSVNVKIEGTVTPMFPDFFNAEKREPWYVNSSPVMLNYYQKMALALKSKDLPGQGQLLKEVKITGKKIVTGSQNLNGPGNADFVMDEKDLEKEGKKTWMNLLLEKVPGFREGVYHQVTHTDIPSGATLLVDQPTSTSELWYYVKDKRVRLIVDGIELDSVISMTLTPGILNEKLFLESHTADDIKGIEVNYSPKYRSSYELMFGSSPDPIRLSYAFIEITTRSGKGPFITNTPGLQLFRPLAISAPVQYYKPKYNASILHNSIADARATIDWEPNIITNLNGEATISFYCGDNPTNYTIIVEGVDLNGLVGYSSTKLLKGDFSRRPVGKTTSKIQ